MISNNLSFLNTHLIKHSNCLTLEHFSFQSTDFHDINHSIFAVRLHILASVQSEIITSSL